MSGPSQKKKNVKKVNLPRGKGSSSAVVKAQQKKKTLPKSRPKKTKNWNVGGGDTSSKFDVRRTRHGLVAVDKRDPRNAARVYNLDKNITSSTGLGTLSFDLNPNQAIFYGFPAALVSYALQRGWMTGGDNTSAPFFAFSYLVGMVISSAVNSIPQSTVVPQCVAFYLQSLVQKKVRALGGHVTYKFAVTQNVSTPPILQLGPNGSANWNLYVPGNGAFNTLFKVGMPPGAYSVDQGSAAWTSLIQFLVALHGDNDPMFKLVSATEPNKMTKDVSAYSVVVANPGGGYFSNGGFGSIKSLEVPIRHPLFAVNYVNVPNEDSTVRYPRFLCSSAGDGFFLGGMTSFISPKQLACSNPPVFKCMDLNEFIEVYALTLFKAMNLALNDPQTQTALFVNGSTGVQAIVDSYQCPLTFTEFSLILRATLMSAFNATQAFVQSIFPRLDTGNTNLFTACVSSANTCPISGTTGLQLPVPLVENIKSSTYTTVNTNPKNPTYIMPILGIYSQDILSGADYAGEVTLAGTSYPFNLFAPEASAVSLIDGTAAGSQIVFINDPGALDPLISSFNNWLNGISGISNFICKLATLSNDAGVTVLTNMNLTSYWIPVEQETVSRSVKRSYFRDLDAYEGSSKKGEMPKQPWKSTPVEERFGHKVGRDRLLTMSPYSDRQILDYSFRFPPSQSVWTSVQQVWIKPVINAVTANSVASSTQVSRIAAQQSEFNQQIVVLSTAAYTISAMHDMFASTMVGGRNQARGGEMMDIFTDLAVRGEASIFSDIASAFGSVVKGAAVAGQVAGAIMPMLG